MLMTDEEVKRWLVLELNRFPRDLSPASVCAICIQLLKEVESRLGTRVSTHRCEKTVGDCGCCALSQGHEGECRE